MPSAKASATPQASAAITATAGFASRTSAKTASIGSTSAGAVSAAAAPFSTKGSSTPASIPPAIPSGISATARPRGRIAPVSAISRPATTKAPTACGIVRPEVAATSAAPGVDQASTTGTRCQLDSSADPTALPRQTASTQLAVCAGIGAHRRRRRQHQRDGRAIAHQCRHEGRRDQGSAHEISVLAGGLSVAMRGKGRGGGRRRRGRRRGTAAGSVGPREEERAAEIELSLCGGAQGGGEGAAAVSSGPREEERATEA